MTTWSESYKYQQWYRARREAIEYIAAHPPRQLDTDPAKLSAQAVIDLTDSMTELDPKFAEYVKKHTEEDVLENLLEKASGEAYYLGARDEYGDLDIMDEIRDGKITYPDLVKRIRETGQKLIEIADAAKY